MNKNLNKLKEQESQENNETKKDYTKYGYKSDSVLSIKGQELIQIHSAIVAVLNQEQKAYFKPPENKEGGAVDFVNQQPVIFLTENGYILRNVIDVLEEVHVRAVDNGLATPIEELEQIKHKFKREDPK